MMNISSEARQEIPFVITCRGHGDQHELHICIVGREVEDNKVTTWRSGGSRRNPRHARSPPSNCDRALEHTGDLRIITAIAIGTNNISMCSVLSITMIHRKVLKSRTCLSGLSISHLLVADGAPYLFCHQI
jgi:hypothetical protein